MPISTLYNHPRVLHQKSNDDSLIPEPDISASLDASPLIIINQGGSEIIINLESVPELCAMLKRLRNMAQEQ